MNDVKISEKDLRQLWRASAGTGKTHALTGHYLKLLRAEAEPDTILATTFTRKAAGEIFGRVLTRAAEQADTDPEARALTLKLCGVLQRMAISTLDSFFQRMGAGFRLELDIPADPVVVDDKSPLAAGLRQRTIARLLSEGRGRADHLDTMLDLLMRLHHDTQKRSVATAIDGIVMKHSEVFREASELEQWTGLEVPTEPDDADMESAARAIEGLKDVIPTNKGDGLPAKAWLGVWEKDPRLIREGEWDLLMKKGLSNKILFKQSAFSRKEIPDEWRKAYGRVVQKIKAVQLGRIVRQSRATWELMSRFDALYSELRVEQGVLLYSDIPQRLVELVDPTGDTEARFTKEDLMNEIQFRLDAKVTHLLLDEFQDTSTGQWRILERFAREILSEGDRSLFVVGDTKQAIYGWRGGEARLFDAVEEMMGPDASKTMDTSYRSSPAVLGVVNRVFAEVAGTQAWKGDKADLKAAQQFAAAYEPLEPHHLELPGLVSFESSPPQEGTADDDVDFVGGERDEPNDGLSDPDNATEMVLSHFDFVARRVGEIHAQAPGATIGVLATTNAAIDRLLLKFQKAGLPASGEGRNPLADHPAVAHLLAVLCVADHPGDAASVFQIRRGPIAEQLGFTADARPAVVARELRAQLSDRGFADLLAEWATWLAPHVDDTGRAKLNRLVQLAVAYDAQYPAADTLRPRRFVDFVEQTKVEEPTQSPIRVMTVHKSKGLEFDVVVLPELDKKLMLNAQGVLIDRPDPLGPVHGVYRWPKKELRDIAPQLEQAYSRERTRRHEENLCALYVAMTRAERALFLLVEPANENRKDSSTVTHGNALRDILGNPDDKQNRTIAFTGDGDVPWYHGFEAADQALPTVDRGLGSLDFPRDAAPTRMRPTVSPSSAEVRGGTVRGAALLSRQPSWGQRYGTRVHEALCEIEYVDDFDEGGASEELVKAFGHDLVREAFTRRFDREDAPWRERRFAVLQGGRVLRGSFDRVVVGRNAAGEVDAVHLIDFKTDALKAGDDATLKRKVETYRGQMDAYREALSILLKLPHSAITAELLFVGPGIRAEV